MVLLEQVVQASGGLELWRQLRRFTVHLSIGGPLCNGKCGCGPAPMKDVVVEGPVHEQELEITGFTAPDRRALYRPDWVLLERSDGEVLKERHATPAEFRHDLKAKVWDELLLAFYCGSLIRGYLDVPFVLADADVVTEELAHSGGRHDERSRRLRVRLPERLAAHSAESTFYFDSQAMLQRQEYPAPQEDGARISQTFSGHQRYSGILIPTLCQLSLERGNSVTVVDIEIFDASFE